MRSFSLDLDATEHTVDDPAKHKCYVSDGGEEHPNYDNPPTPPFFFFDYHYQKIYERRVWMTFEVDLLC